MVFHVSLMLDILIPFCMALASLGYARGGGKEASASSNPAEKQKRDNKNKAEEDAEDAPAAKKKRSAKGEAVDPTKVSRMLGTHTYRTYKRVRIA